MRKGKWINSFMMPEDERIYLGQICVTTPFYIKLKNKPYKAPENLFNYYLTYLENFKFLVGGLSIKDTEKQEIINEINFYKKGIKSGKVEIL